MPSVADLFPPWFLLCSAIALLAVQYHRVETNPLRRIPGPWYARWTSLVVQRQSLTGRKPFYVHSLHERYGPVVRISPDEIGICDTTAVKEIHRVGGPYLKGEFYANVGHKRVQNLFTATDPKFHASRRRLLSGGLSDKVLQQQHEPTLARRIGLYISRMADESKRRGGAVDVLKWNTFLTMDIIGELSFGAPFGMLEKGEKDQFSADLEGMAWLMILRTTFPSLAGMSDILPIPAFRRAAESGKRMLDESQAAIEKCRRRIKDGNQDHPTLFDAVLSSGSLNDMEIIREGETYISAGSDTTGISLTYLFWTVCGRPAIRDRLVAELSTLPHDFRDADARKLPYLNRVIDETLRLFPAVPGVLPRVVPPSGAVHCGYSIPGGNVVSTQAYTLHRDPLLFPDPERFDPDRWEDPSSEMLATFMPFGGGTRSCIGVQLARMELRLIIAHFFRSYPNATQSSKEGMSETDMDQDAYFLVTPKGHRCLIDL